MNAASTAQRLDSMEEVIKEVQTIHVSVTQRHAEHLNQVTIQAGLAMDRAKEAADTSKEILGWMKGSTKLVGSALFAIILLLLGIIFHVDVSNIFR